jgi:pimeloyl-ACP methyl ester carboxylesterase
MSRHLTIPTADTQLDTVDNSGGAPPLLFLSGGFGTIHNWNRVIDRLGGRYRAVLFDARAPENPVPRPTIPCREP